MKQERPDSLCKTCKYGISIKGKAIRSVMTYQETHKAPEERLDEEDNPWKREIERSMSMESRKPEHRPFPEMEIEAIESFSEDLVDMSINQCFFPYENGVIPSKNRLPGINLGNCYITECSRYSNSENKDKQIDV